MTELKSKRKLELRYTDESGKEHIAVLTDTDKDGKPEIYFRHPDFFGSPFELGPHESPIAFPDVLGLLRPLAKRLIPSAFANLFK